MTTKIKKHKTVSRLTLPKGGTQYSEMQFYGFAGLNNKYSNVEIADNEASDLLNVEFDDVGAIVQRNGYTLKKNFGATQIKSILPFYTSAGTRKMLVTYGTSIIQYDPVSGTQSTVTTTLTGSGLRFSSALDTPHNKVYLMNGNNTDGLMSWDGTTFVTGITSAPAAWQVSTAYTVGQHVQNGGNVYTCTTPGTSATSGGPTGTGTGITDGTVVWSYLYVVGVKPQGQYVLWYKNHLYVTGDTSNPNRLYMSDQGDPTSWPVSNYDDFDDGVGGINAIEQLGDSLIVFKDVGVFILKGSDPSSYVVVDTFAGQRGAVGQWSIVKIPNALIFLARDGVWMFDGKKFTLLSYKIQGSIDNWNQQQLANAVAFEYDHRYWLSVPEGSSTNVNTYVYSYEFGWWTKHNIAMNAADSFEDSTMTILPYFTDTSGNLFHADTGTTDNGTLISSYLITKAFNLGTSAHVKSFKQVFTEALAQPGSYVLNLTFILDFGLNQKTLQMPLSYAVPTLWGTFTWGVDNWGGDGQAIHASTNLPNQATYIQFKLQSDGPFQFFGWTVRYKVKRMMTR